MMGNPGSQPSQKEKVGSPLSIVLDACDASVENMTVMIDRLEQKLDGLLREDIPSPSVPEDQDRQPGGTVVTKIVRHNDRLGTLNFKIQSMLNRLDV